MQTKTLKKIQSRSIKEKDFNKMINQLHEKYNSTKKNDKKIMILSVLPKLRSVSKIQAEFGATQYVAVSSKKVGKEGILIKPKRKHREGLSKETILLLYEFFKSDLISRMMPGEKDCVSIKVNKVQKKKFLKCMILCTPKEAYQAFKDEYPDKRIGFTKFTMLKPKNVVLPGSSGIHNVLCLHHRLKFQIVINRSSFKYY